MGGGDNFIGLIAVVVGIVFGIVVVGVAEVFALRLLGYGTRPNRIYFTLLSAGGAFLAALLSVFLVIALYGIGLIIAMDKGYDSGEGFVRAGSLSLILFPVLTYFSRLILFMILKLGNFTQGLLYSLASSTVVVFFVTGGLLIFFALAS